jgi:hypothetical protein
MRDSSGIALPAAGAPSLLTMVKVGRWKVSKSALKAKMLEYFRRVEETGEELIVTDNGEPVSEFAVAEITPDLC